MNYRCRLRYEGTRYRGFQKQGNQENTIQAKLEALLNKAFSQEVEVYGSGRTDAGVHALGQVISFHLQGNIPPPEVQSTMNAFLPEDIQVLSCEQVPERFHARLSAVGKTYRYEVHIGDFPDAFRRKLEWHVPKLPDMERLRQAADLLIGAHDFRGFTEKQGAKKNTLRTIKAIDIRQEHVSDQESRLVFTLRGNGFLYHMVRLIVGTLLEVGWGTKELTVLKTILETGDRSLATLAPAHGLYLIRVEYKE